MRPHCRDREQDALPRGLDVYYGQMMWAGLSSGRGCGITWNGPQDVALRCARGPGSYPATPFATGPLEVLSAGLARRVADDAHIARFVHRAARTFYGGRTDEDVLLGVWVRHLQASSGLQVTYASPALGRLHDIHCLSHTGIYRIPKPSDIVVHRLFSPQRLQYVWTILQGCAAHNRRTCMMMHNHNPLWDELGDDKAPADRMP